MRGFRGSRAAQQFFGRHGQNHSVNQNGGFQGPHNQTNTSAASRLPEWMKTPETKAREQEEAKKMQFQQVQAQVHAKKHVYDHPRSAPAAHAHKPHLKLVTHHPAAPAAAKKTAPAFKAAAPVAKNFAPAAKTFAPPKASKPMAAKPMATKPAMKAKAKPAAASVTKLPTKTARPKTAVAAKRKSA